MSTPVPKKMTYSVTEAWRRYMAPIHPPQFINTHSLWPRGRICVEYAFRSSSSTSSKVELGGSPARARGNHFLQPLPPYDCKIWSPLVFSSALVVIKAISSPLNTYDFSSNQKRTPVYGQRDGDRCHRQEHEVSIGTTTGNHFQFSSTQ